MLHGDEMLRRMVARINANAYLPSDIGERLLARRRTMAKQVKLAKGREFKFQVPKAGGIKYAWDEWLATGEDGFGQLLMLEQAVGTGVDDKGNITGITKPNDFAVSVDAMIPKIKTAGRRRYLVVDVSRYDADGKKLVGSLIIRSRTMSADERFEEDKKRAYERARDDETRRIREESGHPADSVADDDDESDSPNE